MIVIVDLDVGNLANVKKALDGEITADPAKIEQADKIVLPGVGNFGAALQKLDPFREPLLKAIEGGKPFLGICLGMHLLFDKSEEGSGEGLGVLSGEVVKFKRVRTPHIGWNQVYSQKEGPLMANISDGSYFYFVHSYYVSPEDENVISGTTDYTFKGEQVKFPSIVRKDNVLGVQFHPEKSGSVGLRMLRNFKKL